MKKKNEFSRQIIVGVCIALLVRKIDAKSIIIIYCLRNFNFIETKRVRNSHYEEDWSGERGGASTGLFSFSCLWTIRKTDIKQNSKKVTKTFAVVFPNCNTWHVKRQSCEQKKDKLQNIMQFQKHCFGFSVIFLQSKWQFEVKIRYKTSQICKSIISDGRFPSKWINFHPSYQSETMWRAKRGATCFTPTIQDKNRIARLRYIKGHKTFTDPLKECQNAF